MSAVAALLLLHLLGATDGAAPPDARVIGSDHRSAVLLRDGCSRSSTLRALVANIDASRWRVFVQEGACPTAETVGCLLHTVGHFHGEPYLRIRISMRGRGTADAIATLGHELQHAWEAISSPDVVDAETLSAMFRRIGYESLHLGSTTVFETSEADRIGGVVLRELESDNVHGR